MSKKYSDVSAALSDVDITITCHRVRKSPKDTVTVKLADIESGSTVALDLKVKSFHFKNKIILVQPIKNTDDVIVVYTKDGSVFAYRHNSPDTHPLSSFLVVRSKAFFIRLTRRGIRFVYVACIINSYKLPIKATYFRIDNDFKKLKKVPEFTNGINVIRLFKEGIFTDYVPMSPLLEGEPQINSGIYLSIKLDGNDRFADHDLTRGVKRYTNRPKWYYAPIYQARRDGYSISIRRNANGGLSIVRRHLEAVEKTLKFRFYESSIVSFLLYYMAHAVRRLSKANVNLYFEKHANQSEEGAIDIFRMARDRSPHSKNYFIIRDTAYAYRSLNKERNVVTNFTLQSYWLMYRANNIIATEVPQHMNILRSGNKYARRAPYSQKFIFLQHGVTYLKPQDKTTSFKRGREGEPDYMVVNSLKERDVSSDMLNIEEERFINSGMPIFDTIRHNHIDNTSPDIVTIMLTWKPYEEHFQDFSKSTYYKNTVRLYEMLKKHVDKDKIRIIAHPKFKNKMLGTDMESALWQDSVSQALEQTKLLITDYSSVCYNVFYQGGGVIFYQPDLKRYQQATGKLIPNNDEYIGERFFSELELSDFLNKSLAARSVKLSALRSKKFIDNYNSINEHSDGNNIQRLYLSLSRMGIV